LKKSYKYLLLFVSVVALIFSIGNIFFKFEVENYKTINYTFLLLLIFLLFKSKIIWKKSDN